MSTSERAERLSRGDAARWHMATPENPMVIGAALLFDDRLALETVEALARDKLVSHRRFRQHVVETRHRFGRPSWRDDDGFDVRDHVRKLNPPVPTDAAGLVALASERMSARLPPERSPWSFELVDLAPAGSALLVRVHHCIADGRALVAVLEELADEAPRAREAASPPPPPSPPVHRRKGWLGQLVGLFRFLTLSGDPDSPLRRPLAGKKRIAWSEPISLDAVKSIAEARGHHVTDVLLAAVAGALDRHARDQDWPSRSVRALFPVALPSRSSADGEGNHYASVFVRLPIDIADPQARIDAVAHDMSALRTWGESRMAIGLTRLAGSVAPGIERRAMRRWSRRASLVVSNLAGPDAPLHVAGHPIRSVVVWAPTPASIGLSLTFFGYAGALRLAALADAAVIDRPEALVAAFQPALDELARGTLPGSA